MSYGDPGYVSYHRDNERVASMIRSITQDGCLQYKNRLIDPFFPRKMVKNHEGKEEDIGKIYSDIKMQILGSIKEYSSKDDDPSVQNSLIELLDIIDLFYDSGIHPFAKDSLLKFIFNRTIHPSFIGKIGTLPGTGKVAPLASLYKPEKKEKRDISDVQW